MAINQKTLSLGPICGRLNDFRTDIGALQKFFVDNVSTVDSVVYRDNCLEYDGWSITSRTGEVDDNIRRSKKGQDKLFGTPPKTATVPTSLCFGVVKDILETLSDNGFSHYRARFLRLQVVSYSMAFHMDRVERQDSWRIHIPVFTNPRAYFQWRTEDGEISQVHMPADGHAYAVRVDVMHRAVNNIVQPTENGRVHLVLSLSEIPDLSALDVQTIGAMRPGGKGYSGMLLDHTIDLCDRRSGGSNIRVSDMKLDKRLVMSTRSSATDITSTNQTGLLIRKQGSTEDLVRTGPEVPIKPSGLVKILLLWEVFDALRKREVSLFQEICFLRLKDGSYAKGTFNSGQSISIANAICALAQLQSNSVAKAVASFLFGDEDNCSAQLNARARDIGMYESNFIGVTGHIHNKSNSTAADLLLLANALYSEFPEYWSCFSKPDFMVGNKKWCNRNPLLNSDIDVDGLMFVGNKSNGYNYLFSVAGDEARLFGLVYGAVSEKEAALKAIWGVKKCAPHQIPNEVEVDV